ERGKMHHGHRTVAPQGRAQERAIGQVSDHELAPFGGLSIAARKIVVAHWRKAGPVQSLAGMTADEPGAACYENGRHRDTILAIRRGRSPKPRRFGSDPVNGNGPRAMTRSHPACG